MMPRVSGRGKGQPLPLTPSMIDMTSSPREPSTLSVAPPSSTRSAHNTLALLSLAIPAAIPTSLARQQLEADG